MRQLKCELKRSSSTREAFDRPSRLSLSPTLSFLLPVRALGPHSYSGTASLLNVFWLSASRTGNIRCLNSHSARHLIPYYAEIFSASSLARSLALSDERGGERGCGRGPPTPSRCSVHEAPGLAAPQLFQLECQSDLDPAVTLCFASSSFQLWFSFTWRINFTPDLRPLTLQPPPMHNPANCALAWPSLACRDDLYT